MPNQKLTKILIILNLDIFRQYFHMRKENQLNRAFFSKFAMLQIHTQIKVSSTKFNYHELRFERYVQVDIFRIFYGQKTRKLFNMPFFDLFHAIFVVFVGYKFPLMYSFASAKAALLAISVKSPVTISNKLKTSYPVRLFKEKAIFSLDFWELEPTDLTDRLFSNFFKGKLEFLSEKFMRIKRPKIPQLPKN